MAPKKSVPSSDSVKANPSCKHKLAQGLSTGTVLAIHKASKWYQQMTGCAVGREKWRKFYDKELVKHSGVTVMKRAKDASKISKLVFLF